MVKKISYKLGDVLNLRINNKLYVLAQSFPNHLFTFFDIYRTNGVWKGIDLNHEKILFSIYASSKVITSLMHEVVSDVDVSRSTFAAQNEMLNANILGGMPVQFKVDLIQLGGDYEPLNATVLKTSLMPSKDIELIYSRELVGMVGNSEKLIHRLTRYFATGVNWDDQKSFIFPGIPLPKAQKIL